MTAFLSQTFLPALLNMSLTAGIVILCVIAARLFLKRAPKIFSYALWAVVLFRLLCPVSLPSPFSLLGALDAPARQASPVVSTVTYVQPQRQTEDIQPQVAKPEAPVSDPVTPVAPGEPKIPTVDWTAVAAWVWLAGAAGMAGYSVFTLLRLRRATSLAALELVLRVFECLKRHTCDKPLSWHRCPRQIDHWQNYSAGLPSEMVARE